MWRAAWEELVLEERIPMDVPFFFSPLFLLLPYNFLEKTSICSLEDELYSREKERQNRSSYVMSFSFSVPLVPSLPPFLPPSVFLYFPSSLHPCCVFLLSRLLSHCWTISPVCVSVCGSIFGPSKATKHSLLSCSCSFSLFLFSSSAAIWHWVRAYRKCKLWWPLRIVEKPARLTCFHVWCAFNPSWYSGEAAGMHILKTLCPLRDISLLLDYSQQPTFI